MKTLLHGEPAVFRVQLPFGDCRRDDLVIVNPKAGFALWRDMDVKLSAHHLMREWDAGRLVWDGSDVEAAEVRTYLEGLAVRDRAAKRQPAVPVRTLQLIR